MIAPTHADLGRKVIVWRYEPDGWNYEPARLAGFDASLAFVERDDGVPESYPLKRVSWAASDTTSVK